MRKDELNSRVVRDLSHQLVAEQLLKLNREQIKAKEAAIYMEAAQPPEDAHPAVLVVEEAIKTMYLAQALDSMDIIQMLEEALEKIAAMEKEG